MLALVTQFVRNSPVVAFVKDLDGRYCTVSQSWLELFGVREEEVVGKRDDELFAPADAERFTAQDKVVLETRATVRAHETVPVGVVQRAFFTTKFPLFDAQGNPVGIGAFAMDVTDRQNSVAQLQQQARFLERTQAMTSIGGWEFDLATKTLVWTAETYRLFEVDPRTFLPDEKSTLAFFAPEHRDTVRAAHVEAAEKGASFRLEVDAITGQGRRLRVRTHAVPEVVGGKVVRLSGAFQDITEERLTEEKLRHSSRMDAVGQLAGGVAHDFNNMLGAIVSSTELLRFEQLSENALEAVNIILTASTQAAGLTRQLLTFSRKERSQRKAIELHAVLDDAVTILQRTVTRRIALVVEKGAKRSMVLGDGPQLSNAIINLALNARDAMPEGGTLTFRTTEEAHEVLRLDVIDTGMGMAPEVLAHIFDPFFTTKERGRGTGLGLATVDSAVRSHDGDISVKSEPGEGTTFSIRLPLLGEGAPEAVAATAPAKKTVTRALILVVDDESLVRRSTVRLLERLGYRTLQASEGGEALTVLATAEEKPTMMMLDLVMPGLSAVATFHAAREILPELPVLFCSGYAPELILASIENSSRTARLAKPFGGKELEAAVQSLLV